MADNLTGCGNALVGLGVVWLGIVWQRREAGINGKPRDSAGRLTN